MKLQSTLLTPQQQAELLVMMVEHDQDHKKQQQKKSEAAFSKLQAAKIEYFQSICLVIEKELETLDEKQMPTIVLVKEQFKKDSFDAFELANLCCQVLIESLNTEIFFKMYSFFYPKIHDFFSFQSQFLSIIHLENQCISGLWRYAYFEKARIHIKAVDDLLEQQSAFFIIKKNDLSLNINLINIHFTQADILSDDYLCLAKNQDKSKLLENINITFLKMKKYLENINDVAKKREFAVIVQQQEARTKAKLKLKNSNLEIEKNQEIKEQKEKTKLTKTLEISKTEIAELKKQLSSSRKEIDKLMIKGNQICSTSKDQLEKIENLESTNQQRICEKEKLRSAYKKLNEEMLLLAAENHALKTENNQLQQTVAENSHSVTELARQYEEKLRPLQNHNLIQKEYGENLETEIKGFARKIKSSNRKIKRLQSRFQFRNNQALSIQRGLVAENDILRSYSYFMQYRNRLLEDSLCSSQAERQSLIEDLNNQINYLKLLLLQFESMVTYQYVVMLPEEQFSPEQSIVSTLPFEVGQENSYSFFALAQQRPGCPQVYELLNSR